MLTHVGSCCLNCSPSWPQVGSSWLKTGSKPILDASWSCWKLKKSLKNNVLSCFLSFFILIAMCFKWPQVASCWPQVGLKLPQVGLKLAQVGPCWLQLASSWGHVGPGSGSPAAPEPTQALPESFPSPSRPYCSGLGGHRRS